MKPTKVQACIDFIRFSHNTEGFDLSEAQEEALSDILNGDRSADELVQEIIDANALDTTFLNPGEGLGFYPDSPKCQVNYFNIKDRDVLRKIEMNIISIRLAQILSEDEETKFDFETLQTLHSKLFGDIYPSAGEVRTENASKRTVFCRPEFIDKMSKTVFEKLRNDRYLRNREPEDFINELAYYMGEVEALHPFWDGNGRAIRIFFYLLVLSAGYDLQWYSIDPDRLLEADICAIDGEYQLLIDVLCEALFVPSYN